MQLVLVDYMKMVLVSSETSRKQNVYTDLQHPELDMDLLKNLSLKYISNGHKTLMKEQKRRQGGTPWLQYDTIQRHNYLLR